MSTAYHAISSTSRVRVLHLLQERPDRTVAELCAATGLHPNTVREHLQRLEDGGYIVARTESRHTRGRPRVLYSPAATGTISIVAAKKARAAAERGDLMRRIMPWTRTDSLPSAAVHQLDALVEDLGEAGLEPEIDESALRVDLAACPHAAADPHERSMRCAVHLALMDGVLSQAGGPLHVDAAASVCTPEQCVIQLTKFTR